jgi:hypothetical protein
VVEKHTIGTVPDHLALQDSWFAGPAHWGLGQHTKETMLAKKEKNTLENLEERILNIFTTKKRQMLEKIDRFTLIWTLLNDHMNHMVCDKYIKFLCIGLKF